MPSYLPVTIDGSEIPAEAPRSQAMSDEQAQLVTTKAEEYRQVVMHCHWDLVDRTLTLYAANAPDGPVAFNFGDGSYEVTEESVDGQAQAEHTYARDGVFTVWVRTEAARWHTEVAVNWPAPFPVPPDPIPEES
jgi:hypothetical protein